MYPEQKRCNRVLKSRIGVLYTGKTSWKYNVLIVSFRKIQELDCYFVVWSLNNGKEFDCSKLLVLFYVGIIGSFKCTG